MDLSIWLSRLEQRQWHCNDDDCPPVPQETIDPLLNCYIFERCLQSCIRAPANGPCSPCLRIVEQQILHETFLNSIIALMIDQKQSVQLSTACSRVISLASEYGPYNIRENCIKELLELDSDRCEPWECLYNIIDGGIWWNGAEKAMPQTIDYWRARFLLKWGQNQDQVEPFLSALTPLKYKIEAALDDADLATKHATMRLVHWLVHNGMQFTGLIERIFDSFIDVKDLSWPLTEKSTLQCWAIALCAAIARTTPDLAIDSLTAISRIAQKQLISILSGQDDVLFSVLYDMLYVHMHADVPMPLNPASLWNEFVRTIGDDHSSLIDFLLDPDTIFLEYLLLLLKYVTNTGETSLNIDILIRLKQSLIKVERHFPYPMQPLISRIQDIEYIYYP